MTGMRECVIDQGLFEIEIKCSIVCGRKQVERVVLPDRTNRGEHPAKYPFII